MAFSMIAYDAAAFFLLLACFAFGLERRRIHELQRNVFLMLTVVTFLSTVASMANFWVGRHFGVDPTGISLRYLTKIIYYFAQVMMPAIYCEYMMSVNSSAASQPHWQHVMLMTPLVIMEVLVVSSPWTQWMLSYDAEGIYSRGPLVFILVIFGLSYVVLGLINLVYYRRVLRKGTLRAVFLTSLITLVGMAVQFMVPTVRIQIFAESLTYLGLMFAIELGRDDLDPVTKVYNRNAFRWSNIKYLATGRHYNIIYLRIPNLGGYLSAMEINQGDRLINRIADWLLLNFKRVGAVYRLSIDSFAVVTNHANPTLEAKMITDLSDAFAKDWIFEGTHLHFNAVVAAVRVPDEFDRLEDIERLSTAELHTAGNRVAVLVGADLDFVRREALVDRAVRRAVENKSFRFYYQPIWDKSTNRIFAAEALTRLIDNELGFISPDEFIPIAERTGAINDIGLQCFEDACKMMAGGQLSALGIHYIEVNLSGYQLMQEDLTEQFQRILSRYKLPSSAINLEITETTASDHTKIYAKSLQELKAAGFAFSLDDFGTGYSNMTRLFSDEFSNIKIDKSILWEAYGKSEQDTSYKFLNGILHTIHDMNAHVIQEGVETEDQLNYVTELGCDYIQGYYFSKPIAGPEFIEYVRKFNG